MIGVAIGIFIIVYLFFVVIRILWTMAEGQKLWMDVFRLARNNKKMEQFNSNAFGMEKYLEAWDELLNKSPPRP